MGAESLSNFKDIFERDDFSYVCDKMSVVCDLIIKVKYPDVGDRKDLLSVGKKYVECLNSFAEWINPVRVPSIIESCKGAVATINWAISMHSQPDEKKSAISRGYINQMKRRFSSFLSSLLIGIRAIFDPDIISESNITQRQIAKYILHKKEGYGRFYLFNKAGGYYAFAKHIFDNEFDRHHAIEAFWNLKQKREYKRNGKLIVWGDGDVRIHLSTHTFGKTRIYSVYRANNGTEHEQHDKDFAQGMARVQFEPA